MAFVHTDDLRMDGSTVTEQVCVIDIEGGSRQRLVQGTSFQTVPAWQALPM